jgi:hypothetical protein
MSQAKLTAAKTKRPKKFIIEAIPKRIRAGVSKHNFRYLCSDDKIRELTQVAVWANLRYSTVYNRIKELGATHPLVLSQYRVSCLVPRKKTVEKVVKEVKKETFCGDSQLVTRSGKVLTVGSYEASL